MAVRMVAVVALLALAGVPLRSAWAEDAAPILEMSADGEILVAPDGSISDYRLRSELAPNVAQLVDKAVHGWRFEPIMVDGVPVVAKTVMHLSLKAEPAGGKGDYRIRIVDVHFGEPRRDGLGMRPPHYPKEAVRAHLGAKVLLAVQIDDSGKVVDAQPYQTSLDARTGSDADAERWRKMFELASVTAAKAWHYDLSETIDGKPAKASALVPVVFSIGASPQQGKWKVYVPGPLHMVPWMGDKRIADGGDLSSLSEDRALPLDSHFRLKDDVVGKTL